MPTLSSKTQDTKRGLSRSCTPETPQGTPPSGHLCPARGGYYCWWHRVRAVSMDTVYPGWIPPLPGLFILLSIHLFTPFINFIPLDVIFY